MQTFLLNMGVPMIFPALYLMIAALLPIVFLEGYFFASKLRIDLWRTLRWTALANLISTVVGIPFTWFILFVFQMITGGTSSYNASPFLEKLLSVTIQAPWLLPIERQGSWTIYAAGLFLLIPFFFASWMIEYFALRNKLAAEVYAVREQQAQTNDSDQDFAQPQIDDFEGEVKRRVRDANLLSYSLLASFLILLLIYNLIARL